MAGDLTRCRLKEGVEMTEKRLLWGQLRALSDQAEISLYGLHKQKGGLE